MRYRRILTSLGVLAVALFAYATTYVRQPTVSELSTAWVGWADSLGYFRVQLSENGTGLCGFYERSTSGPRLYEVTKWTLKDLDIELTLKPIDPDAWALTMKGNATPGELFLILGDARKKGWGVKAYFRHESMIDSMAESTKKRMRDYRKPTDTK